MMWAMIIIGTPWLCRSESVMIAITVDAVDTRSREVS